MNEKTRAKGPRRRGGLVHYPVLMLFGVFFAGMPPWAGLPGGQGGASRRAGGKPVALIWETSATDLWNQCH